MIIGRTPFRISFFGGGTDYPQWFRENKGAVLSTSIDKYCYISCRFLPPFFEHKTRLVYSKMELVKSIADLEHPAAKAVIQYLGIGEGLEIHHDGDLPARSGIGSSSSFTVGLLNALTQLLGQNLSKEELARQSIYIEQEIIKENVGSQDQTSAVFGGLNLIEFLPSQKEEFDDIIVKPIAVQENIQKLESNLMLFYLGTSRLSSEIAGHFLNSIKEKKDLLKEMYQMVFEAKKIIESQNWDDDFGKLLHKSWMLKRSISPYISLSTIDIFYERALSLGALGGKLLGAGGGGFFLLYARPEIQKKILQTFSPLILHVPFKFENQGTQIIYGSSTSTHQEKRDQHEPSFNEKQYH